MNASEVFATSDGAVTRAYYAKLLDLRLGLIAVNLFRAQKCSTRAKLYRGGGYRGMAYERKEFSLRELGRALSGQTEIGFGWKRDPKTIHGLDPMWVMYVDLPNGQVSFHSPTRFEGPDYAGEWDGMRASERRILEFCDAVMEGREIRTEPLPKPAAQELPPLPSVESFCPSEQLALFGF